MKKLSKNINIELQDLFKNELKVIHSLQRQNKEEYFIELVDFFEENGSIYMIEERPRNLKEYVLKTSKYEPIPEAKIGLIARSMV